jgi:DNA-binding HxlR family transcriptional regulator
MYRSTNTGQEMRDINDANAEWGKNELEQVPTRCELNFI